MNIFKGLGRLLGDGICDEVPNEDSSTTKILDGTSAIQSCHESYLKALTASDKKAHFGITNRGKTNTINKNADKAKEVAKSNDKGEDRDR